MSEAFSSADTLSRAMSYLQAIGEALDVEFEVKKYDSFGRVFLRAVLGGDRGANIARAYERQAKTGPYRTEFTGQVTIVVGDRDAKKTFTESKKTHSFSDARIKAAIDWAKAYAAKTVEERKHTDQIWRDRQEIGDAWKEAFKDPIPAARRVEAGTTIWSGIVLAKLAFSFPKEAIVPVVAALRQALAPYVEEDDAA